MISDRKLDVLIDQIQKLETPKQFRGQCIRSNAVQALQELKERRAADNNKYPGEDHKQDVMIYNLEKLTGQKWGVE